MSAPFWKFLVLDLDGGHTGSLIAMHGMAQVD